jgi:hypothetical protein
MEEKEARETVRCERYPGLSPAGRVHGIDTPEQPHPGIAAHARIRSMPGYVFLCFTDAHPEQDHVFRVGNRKVSIPWQLFRTCRVGNLFLDHEVQWE